MKRLISANNEEYRQQNTVFADDGFFQMFSFPLVSGNLATALKDFLYRCAHRKHSEKYFGNENPIGKVIRIQDDYDCIVTAVAKDLPSDSDLKFDVLMPFSTLQNSAKSGLQA